MTEKQRGTADVTVVALVADQEAVTRLTQRFALRARETGTLTLAGAPDTRAVAALYPPTEPGGEPIRGLAVEVRLRYRHTCKNKGNHEGDARRFFERALSDGQTRATFLRAELNDWEATG
jgi:hypothetical protein